MPRLCSFVVPVLVLLFGLPARCTPVGSSPRFALQPAAELPVPPGPRMPTWSGDGRRLAWFDAPDSVTVWDLRLHKQIFTFRNPDVSGVVSFALDHDGSGLLLGCARRGGEIETAELLCYDLTAEGGNNRFVLGDLDGFPRAVWHPRGRDFATCGPGGGIKFWDGGAKAWTATLVGHGLRADSTGGLSLAYAPHGRLLCSMGSDTIRLWDLDKHRQIKLEQNPSQSSPGVFSRDGKLLVASVPRTGPLIIVPVGETRANLKGPPRDDLLVWAADGRLLHRHHLGAVSRPVGFLDDRHVIIAQWEVASQYDTISIIDVTTGRVCMHQRVPPYLELAFCATTQQLATAAEQAPMRLWYVTVRRPGVGDDAPAPGSGSRGGAP
jgi:hypothetical protein